MFKYFINVFMKGSLIPRSDSNILVFLVELWFTFVSSAIFKTGDANTENANHNTKQNPNESVVGGDNDETKLIISCSLKCNMEIVFTSNICVSLSNINRNFFNSSKTNLSSFS